MVKFLVGGYYSSRIFRGADREMTPFDKDINIYTLDEALRLGFVEGVEEWYYDFIQEEGEPDFYELSYEKRLQLVLQYTENDEIAGLVAFDTLQEAVDYVKDVIEEIINAENTHEYVGHEQDEYGYFHEVYEFKGK